MKNLLTGLVIGTLSSSAFATTWIVDDDGLDFPKADFDNIQEAINEASDGDEIEVMPGTYTGTGDEVVNMLGKAVTLLSSDPYDPDVVAATIIDGENTRRGIFCDSEETSDTIIKGFTITQGRLADSPGGGLYCKNAFPEFINCSFENNAAGTIGGGAHCVKGGPSFNTCRFSSNSANRGGGVYTFRSAATFTGCLFDYNDSVYFGGGMYSYQNSPSGEPLRLINCMIKDNLANSGGGIFLSEADNVFEKNCLIESNTAIQAGGGMYCVASSNPSITDCTFKFNEAKVDSGGGIRIVDSSPGPGISDTQFCSNFHNGGHIGGNLFGNHEDLGGNEFLQECSNCPDINGDGFVNVSDLLSIIDQWGLTDSPADVNGDGIVDVSDLLEVVGNWGPCE